MARVVEFKRVSDYQFELRFDDGEVKLIDFEPILSGPIFGELHDPVAFAEVRLVSEFGTLEWPNGADIDPSVLRHWEEHIDFIIERRKALDPR
jgi:hypothetical protein